MNDEDQKRVTITSSPPFTYGMSPSGEFIIGWVMGQLPDGTAIRGHLVLPPQEIDRLKESLEMAEPFRQSLSATPPRHGPH